MKSGALVSPPNLYPPCFQPCALRHFGAFLLPAAVVEVAVAICLNSLIFDDVGSWQPWKCLLRPNCSSQSLPPSIEKNTIAISFAILNSQELFSVSFLRQITLWFGNPKSLQSLQNAQRDTTNFAVNKETLGTFVPRHQGTCRIIPSKPAGLERWPGYGI